MESIFNSSQENGIENPLVHEPGNVAKDCIMLLVSVEIIIGNFLVILTALKYKCFGSKSTNRYIISLGFSDLMIGLIVIPLNILDIDKYHLLFLVQEISVLSSILNLCVVSMDRFLAIARPIRYSRKITSAKVNTTIFFVWLITFCIVLCPPFADYLCIEKETAICDYIHGKEIFMIHLILVFYIPLVLMMLLNYGTYRTALNSIYLKHKKRVSRDQGRMVSSRLKLLITENKLSFTLGLIMLVFVVCWSPFLFVYTVICICPTCEDSLSRAHYFSVWLGISNSGMNPIIHFIMSRKFRKSVIKLITCDK